MEEGFIWAIDTDKPLLQTILPGVAISYILKINYFFGAVVFGILAALGMGFIKENSKLKSDTAIGIVFSAFLALGILLITKIESSIDLNNILFGNVLTVKAVSYTHLDVYKRQALYPAEFSVFNNF